MALLWLLKVTMQVESPLDPLIFNSYILAMVKKLGRPKKPKAERRKKPLRVLLNPAERQALDEFARSKSMEVSTWARGVLLEQAGFAIIPAKS
jgi:hypothetical protein